MCKRVQLWTTAWGDWKYGHNDSPWFSHTTCKCDCYIPQLQMLAAVVELTDRNIDFLKPYWWVVCQNYITKCCTVFIIRGLLKQWAEFSVSNLPSPPLQKCTDDFEGPSPNNVNLAAKVSIYIMCTNPHCCQHGWSQGIVGLAAYTYLLRQNDQNSEADHYDTLNRGYVQYWLKNGLVR